MTPFTEPALRAALAAVCAQRDLPYEDALLVHHYSNAVFALPAAGTVVRFTTSAHTGATIWTTQTAVSRLIHEYGFPATAPLDGVHPVHLANGLTASFWEYYPQPAIAHLFAAADLARLVRRLHDVSDVGIALPAWEPLTSLRGELARRVQFPGLTGTEASWLRDEVAVVSQRIAETTWQLGSGVIHADAWAGNLLWNADQPILGDWDGLAVGPREIDLIPTWHAAIRYGRTGQWVREFQDVYGHDLATNESFELLLHMRDLVQLTGPLRRAADSPKHLDVLRQRIDAIRADDRSARWVAL
ncbi:phosphotransferase [Myceligenerans halotolerans]